MCMPQPCMIRDVFKENSSLLCGKLLGITQLRLTSSRYESKGLAPVEIDGVQNSTDANGPGECSSPGLIDAYLP